MNASTNVNEIRSLTALRGLAAWWVVAYHFRETFAIHSNSIWYTALDHGYLAVDLFFILSGFVIHLNYGKLFNIEIFSSFAEYLVKRFRRIYPLHIFMLLIFLLNPAAILLFSESGIVGERYDLSYLIASIFLIQNWGWFNNVGWNVPAWSISAEFFAYLVFPLFSHFVVNRLTSLTASVLTIILLWVSLAFLFYINGYQSIGGSVPKLGLIRCLMEFSMGVVCCHMYQRGYFSNRRRFVDFFLVGVLICAFVGKLSDYFYVPALFSALIIWLTFNIRIITRLLENSILMFLGLISYSTYMVHYFVRDWIKFSSDSFGGFQFAAYITLVLFISILTYRYVELPGRKFRF